MAIVDLKLANLFEKNHIASCVVIILKCKLMIKNEIIYTP
jgi:hypothetical protein